MACRNIPAGLLDYYDNYIPIPPCSPANSEDLIRRDASEAARCTMNLRLDIIVACHFTRSDSHE